MKFSMTIEMESDAFKPDYEDETARLIREVADKVHALALEGSIADINGNRVGSFKITGGKVRK